MRLQGAGKIVSDQVRGRSLREHYWAAAQMRRRVAMLGRASNRVFARVVLADLTRYLLGTQPIAGQTRERARAAVEWILRAQDAAADGGVSLGYFPCDVENGWLPSYPETTGYIISSLIAYCRQFQDSAVGVRALQMAEWETEIQMRSGAVQGGPICPPEKQTPTAFNTGMVLDGWVTAFHFSQDLRFLEAARRAANWLVSDLNEAGYFQTNGQFVAPGLIKTYNVLCAWALYRLGELLPESCFRSTACRIVDAAIRKQQPNGWFADNCLTRANAPLLHTIAYTLQGILEVGIAANREDFVGASRRGVDALLPRISATGQLAGRFFCDWEPACFSSCLTGAAQLSVVCYRLYEYTRHRPYWIAAERLLNYLKPLQLLNSGNPALDGGLPGSFPLFGGYMTAGYPNWATKYFLDALLLQDRLSDT